jgi:hypothetical protein
MKMQMQAVWCAMGLQHSLQHERARLPCNATQRSDVIATQQSRFGSRKNKKPGEAGLSEKLVCV